MTRIPRETNTTGELLGLDPELMSADPCLADAIERDLIGQLYAAAPVSLAGSLAAATAFVLGLWSEARSPQLAWWFLGHAAVVVVCLVTLRLYRSYWRERSRPALWARRLCALLSSASWVSGQILLDTPGLNVETFAYLMVLVGLSSGMTFTHNTEPWSVTIFSSVCMLGISWITHGDMPWLTPLLVLYVAAFAWLGVRSRRRAISNLKLRYENVELLRVAREGQRQAEQAARSRTRFIAAASHDLRQPVQAIALFAHALRAPTEGPERERIVRRLNEAVGALSSMLEGLLDVSRLDTGAVEMHPQRLSARQLLEEVLAGVRADASDRDAPVYVRGREVAVWADPVLLRRVLHNLASNAVRHGSGAVLLAVRRRSDGCELQVWDEGPGIPEAHQHEIFEEFVQLDNPGRQRSRGLGLGLAMVQRICQQSGWLLRVRSQPERGSMFSVEVPLSQHGALLTSGALSPPPPSEAQQGMIVLVEDDEQVREAMAVTLGAVGYRVRAYESAEAALASLPRERPDVLVSDYRLGGSMTGAQWIVHARRALGESVPAVLISGEVHLGQEGAGTLPERTHHAQKPVSAARLTELVAQARPQR